MIRVIILTIAAAKQTWHSVNTEFSTYVEQWSLKGTIKKLYIILIIDVAVQHEKIKTPMNYFASPLLSLDVWGAYFDSPSLEMNNRIQLNHKIRGHFYIKLLYCSSLKKNDN